MMFRVCSTTVTSDIRQDRQIEKTTMAAEVGCLHVTATSPLNYDEACERRGMRGGGWDDDAEAAVKRKRGVAKTG